jgi:hypothetical protein
VKIINNCLKKEEFIHIQDLMTNNFFPWYITWGVASNGKHDYQFTHTFYYDSEVKSPYFNLLNNILEILKPSSLIRIKANLLTKTDKIIEHGYHIDTKIKNSKTGIFYINTNNGYTKFKNKKLIKSEENKLIFFDSSKEHTGTTCTDELFRIVINFVYTN